MIKLSLFARHMNPGNLRVSFLNTTASWLLFLQVTYVTAFALFAIGDVLAFGTLSTLLSEARGLLHLGNQYVRLSDWLAYPIIFSAPLNFALTAAFLWAVLRRKHLPSFTTDLCSLLNAVYIIASGWILFIAFFNIIHR